MTIIQDNFLTQNVHEPTRGQNILDLVITTDENLVQNIQVGEHIATADHNVIRGEINIAKDLEENNEQIYNYKKGKFNKIKDKLRRINWTTLFQDKSVSNMYDTFSSHLMELVDKHVPKQIRRKSGRPSPKWITNEIKQLLKQKKFHYQKQKSESTVFDLNEYIRLRREVKKKIRQSKRDYEKRIADTSKEDPKSFYAYVRAKKRRKIQLDPY